ncbi:aggregation-promoting factor C-terminal-like domain-containing protein [Jatrophihabitans sp. YIM 134969]
MQRSVAFGLYGVVIAGLVGGTITWATVDKTVRLDVDGQTTSFHTLSGTVKGALSDAGYNPTARDIVAPGLSAKVHDDSEIVLRRGRLLKLTVDGKEREVWVNSPTVSQAMADLGYSTSTFTSVSRSQRLPLSPTSIDIRTPKAVILVHDGQKQTLLTTAASVEQMLTDAGIVLGPIDRLSVPAASAPREGLTVTLQRVSKGRVAEDKTVPYVTTNQPDGSMVKGQTEVVTAGKNGFNRVTYAVIYIDGKIAGKTQVSTQVLSAPTTQVQKVGTAAPPAATPAPSTGGDSGGSDGSSGGGSAAPAVPSGDAQSIAHQMVLARGWGEDQFSCLVSLWNKESGWNVHASNGGSGAYGIPQALPGSKMASAGPDWQDSAATQITWGLGYISGRYGTPCGAWGHSQSTGWY